MTIAARCERIRLVLSDVDGVMTDGGIVLNGEGIETKVFHVRDGTAITQWQRLGHAFGIVTGRSSHIVAVRARELSVSIVHQGVGDKLAVVKQVASERKLSLDQVCFIGDDLQDLAPMRAAGLAVAVADACPEVLAAAQYVTTVPGGRGAVREALETILRAQGLWGDVVRWFDPTS